MSSNDKNSKPWAGRFTAPTDAFVEQFTQSVSYDQRLYHYDILGSIAHVQMLARAGILTEDESRRIRDGLAAIETDIKDGRFEWSTAHEDVHMNIEAELIARIGEVGKKLHTGRSRNDQIATDIRLYLRDEIDTILVNMDQLMSVLLDVAERESDTVMPGFTHMQTAQPITFGHHMLAWFDMLVRDRSRLLDCRRRMNCLPLGAAALAGTSYPIDRHFVAEVLGFDGVIENSLDAVSDRDFAIEFCACSALVMMHLSRFSEELVLWMSQQFGFIELDDAWCTGSSIMPQKKNPDVPELVRGKTGRVYGDLMALLTLMKGQPLAYNRDNQEDKEALFDSIDTVKACLIAYHGILSSMTVKAGPMREAVGKGFATATDLADYLVRKGVPFRDAHAIVGKTVQHALQQDKLLSELDLQLLQQFSAVIEKDVFSCLEPDGSVATRDHIGGTAPARVREAIKRNRDFLRSK